MHIIILGAGISGTLAAYFLGRNGHTIEVIDRQDSAAKECSYANGGQLSYSHAEPWANPYVLKKVFKWMFDEDAPLVFRLSADPHMIKWGLKFLLNCREKATAENSLTMLRLGKYSKEMMAEIVDDTGIEFHHQHKGILHIFCKQAEFEHACKQAEFQNQYGCGEKILSWQECLAMEPALKDSHKKVYGGIHAPIDESGDIHIFTQKLAAYCEEKFGAKFHYNTDIKALTVNKGNIASVETSKGEKKADSYVMCMGAHAAPILRRAGISTTIYPMKGYSVTWNATDDMPHVSITDDARKIVYSRLGDKMRCAGTAEFARYDDSINPKRIAPIMRGIRALFPSADLSQTTEWACLRPATPDGPPIVGKTKYPNLFINCGHGTLGWTQGAGTAQTLADIVDGRTPFLNASALSIDRY